MLDSLVVSRTSYSTECSINRIFGSFDRYFGRRAYVIDLLMPATPLISSLSFIILCFECMVIDFDVPGFLAIIADSIFLETSSDFAHCLAVQKNFVLGYSIG